MIALRADLLCRRRRRWSGSERFHHSYLFYNMAGAPRTLPHLSCYDTRRAFILHFSRLKLRVPPSSPWLQIPIPLNNVGRNHVVLHLLPCQVRPRCVVQARFTHKIYRKDGSKLLVSISAVSDPTCAYHVIGRTSMGSPWHRSRTRRVFVACCASLALSIEHAYYIIWSVYGVTESSLSLLPSMQTQLSLIHGS